MFFVCLIYSFSGYHYIFYGHKMFSDRNCFPASQLGKSPNPISIREHFMKHSPTVSNSMFVVQKQYLEYWLEESEIAQSSRLIVKLFSFCILQTKSVIRWANAVDFWCCWNSNLSNWNENIWGSLLQELEQGIVASLPPQILLNPVQGRLPAPADIHLASKRTTLSFSSISRPRMHQF